MSKENMPYTDILIPNTLNGIIGQSHITIKLNGYLKSKNMPHVCLSGLHGLGKSATTEAFLFLYFKGLNETEKARNLLVLEASTQKDRGIAVVEEYRKFTDFPAMGVPFKICVIIEADGLTTPAQKAFKELLSNPLYTKIVRCIIQTNYPNKILPEIRNRCEMMPFKRVQDKELLKWLITTIIPALFNLKLIDEEMRDKLLSNKAEWLVKIVKASDGIPRSVLRKLQTYVQSGIVSSTDEEYTLNPYEMISLSLKGKIIEASKMSDKLIYSDAVNVYSLLNDLRKIVLKEDIKDLRNVYKGELLMYLETLQRDIFSGVSDEMILAGLIGKCVELGHKNSNHKD